MRIYLYEIDLVLEAEEDSSVRLLFADSILVFLGLNYHFVCAFVLS